MHPTRLERRVRRLERVNLGLAVALAATGVLLLTAASTRPEAVRATRFELVDDAGRVRAELRSTAEGTGLYVMDEEGTDRASLLYNQEETAMYLRDRAGDIRVGAAQYAHGGGGLALHGEQAKGATVLYMSDHRGSLRMFDAEGRITYQVPPPEGER